MNQPQFFEIQANEPKKLVDFYGKVFGWSFKEQKNLPIEFWQISTNGIDGAILKRPADVPSHEQGTNAYVVSMEVKDFEETATIIKQMRGTVALPKFAVPGKCWQGYFVDTDNNTFGIFQIDEFAE